MQEGSLSLTAQDIMSRAMSLVLTKSINDPDKRERVKEIFVCCPVVEYILVVLEFKSQEPRLFNH